LCLNILRDLDGPLLTTWAVLTEAFYLLNFSCKAQDNLWEFLARGAMEICLQEQQQMERCRVLMNKYKDLPMDLADATLVATAEAKGIKAIFTIDRKDFSVYRPSHVKRFELIPKTLA
jgi:predicted nucleic acid-binding protein